MIHISACETGLTYKSSIKLSHAYATLIFSKQLSCENKNTKAYSDIRTGFLFISLFKQGVEIRCVARPPLTLLLDRNLSDSLFRSASGGVTLSTISASAVGAQRDNHAILPYG